MYKTVYKVFSLSVPLLISIALLQLVYVELNLYGSFFNGGRFFVVWNVLQLFPAFIFAYISDRHYRKGALIASQCLGFLGGSILYFLGAEPWVLVLIGLTFNPMPVAQAALLDNFPKVSSLKLITLTFLAQYLPWVFYEQLGVFSFKTLILFTLVLMLFNIVLTVLFFQDNKDVGSDSFIHKSISIFKRIDKILIYTFLAFMFAQLSIYSIWIFMDYSKVDFAWVDITNFAGFVGIFCVFLYHRLPHMSLITLFYTIGFGVFLTLLILCNTEGFHCFSNLLFAMGYYCVVAGMYLPFVTEAVIRLVGARHKATGAALVELADTFAMGVGSVLVAFAIRSPTVIVYCVVLFFLVATFLQKRAERTSSK
jgi:MFS family permease